MHGGRCRFRSAELIGKEPVAYADRHLEDLMLFEAPGVEAIGPVGRWLVDPIMKVFHGAMERGKPRVRTVLIPFNICIRASTFP